MKHADKCPADKDITKFTRDFQGREVTTLRCPRCGNCEEVESTPEPIVPAAEEVDPESDIEELE